MWEKRVALFFESHNLFELAGVVERQAGPALGGSVDAGIKTIQLVSVAGIGCGEQAGKSRVDAITQGAHARDERDCQV